jgi:hypothetical protein
MFRSLLVLLITCVSFSSATAALDRHWLKAKEKDIPFRTVRSAPTAANDDFRITAATEVLLDGRPCPFERVPNNATIIFLETTTNESKEIARIHFRTGRPAASPTSAKP